MIGKVRLWPSMTGIISAPTHTSQLQTKTFGKSKFKQFSCSIGLRDYKNFRDSSFSHCLLVLNICETLFSAYVLASECQIEYFSTPPSIVAALQELCHTEIIDPQLIWFESSRLLKHNILMIAVRVMSDNRNIIFAASIHSDETPPSESLFKFVYLFGDIWFWYGRGEHERRAESCSWICERIKEENFSRNAARDLWMCWLESGFPACHK